MTVPPSFEPAPQQPQLTLQGVLPRDASASTTAEMLAALPEGLMLPAGASPQDRRLTDILALYRAVFLNSTDPVAIIDREGRYLEQNVAHELLLGYSADELRGQSPAIHLGEEMFRSLASELQQKGTARREIVSTTKRGERRVLDLSAFAVRDRLGRAVCYVGIKRDITEQRRAAEELNRRFEELQVLYAMADSLGQARALDDIYDQAIDALLRAVKADRASILEFDDDEVMRFRAWRGLSATYRAAVEGHSPWKADTRNPSPVVVGRC